jgi:hypothetical protein
MIFEHIEKLKRQYTDKYVVVADGRPELQRFRGMTGTVRTVNMSGRALVEFDGNNNIGWYDIDPAFLKVVDAPLPKPEEKPAKKAKEPAPKADKPAAESKPAAPVAKPAPTTGKSVAEILAAARSKPTSAAPAAADVPASPTPTAKAPPGGKGMSMADILAAARANKAGGAAPAAPSAKAASEPPAAKTAPGSQESAPAAEEPAAASVASTNPPSAGGVHSLKDKITTVADQVAYCQKTDAKK